MLLCSAKVFEQLFSGKNFKIAVKKGSEDRLFALFPAMSANLKVFAKSASDIIARMKRKRKFTICHRLYYRNCCVSLLSEIQPQVDQCAAVENGN